MEVKIYALYDPTTSTIRYIGRTRQKLSRRLAGHLHKSLRQGKSSHKCCWIRSLLKNGIKPRIRLLKILKDVTWTQSHLIEKEIIQKHLIKHRLVNGDDRGPGYTGAKNISPESQASVVSKLKEFYSDDRNKTNFYNEIHCYDSDGKFYKSYKSTIFASKELGIPRAQIINHRNKRDNYNAQVLNVCGYNFSKYKTDTVKTYSKPNRNARGIQVFDKQGKQLAEFKTFGSFAQQYDLSEWDSSEYAKGKLTKRMKKFLTDHIIKSL